MCSRSRHSRCRAPFAAGACAYFYSSYLEAQAIDLAMSRDAASNTPRVTITGRNLPLDAAQYTITVNAGDQPVSDVFVGASSDQSGAAARSWACGAWLSRRLMPAGH